VVRPLTAATLGKGATMLVVGALVGAVGTVMHRASPPWGLVGCFALVFAAAVTARAWAGWVTWIAYVGGQFFVVQLMAQSGPGGDVLVPAKSVIGWVWVLGSIVVALVVGFLPRRLFDERPAPPVGASATTAVPDDEAAPLLADAEVPDEGVTPLSATAAVPDDEASPLPAAPARPGGLPAGPAGVPVDAAAAPASRASADAEVSSAPAGRTGVPANPVDTLTDPTATAGGPDDPRR
jgi:hypothetical protein